MKKRTNTFAFAAFALVIFAFSAPAFAEGKYQLSSHILDITRGMPAPGVTIVLKKLSPERRWVKIDTKVTDSNGRIKDFLKEEEGKSNAGIYKLTYYVKPYFDRFNQPTFYPFIDVVFEIKDSSHYHVPITLSPFGYSTYRGN